MSKTNTDWSAGVVHRLSFITTTTVDNPSSCCLGNLLKYSSLFTYTAVYSSLSLTVSLGAHLEAEKINLGPSTTVKSFIFLIRFFSSMVSTQHIAASPFLCEDVS